MADQSGIKFLIFDTILNGHHTDYLSYLVDYWCDQQPNGELYLVTPKGFSEGISAHCKSHPGIYFLELSASALTNAKKGSTLKRSFAEWNLYISYCKQIKPDHAILMYFDLFQAGMWLGKKSPCPVSGIYFRPSFHYKNKYSLREILVAFRKKWILSRVLGIPELKNLFCLDKSSVSEIQKLTTRVRIIPLSDPVKEYKVKASQVLELKELLGIENDRKVFLMFGYLDDRKGIEPVLDAIAHLSQAESSKITLVLAGPITVEYRQSISTLIETMDNDAQIVCHFEKLEGALIQIFFELADFVLTLYRRHIGMSSLIIRAALSNKPLISSDFGYVGTLVKEKELGTIVNSESAVSISKAFQQALRGDIEFSEENLKNLAAQNTSSLFAQQIMNVLLGQQVKNEQ